MYRTTIATVYTDIIVKYPDTYTTSSDINGNIIYIDANSKNLKLIKSTKKLANLTEVLKPIGNFG